MSMRFAESLNAALARMLAADERVFVFGEDLSDPYGGPFKVTRGLSTQFPRQVLNTPISEAALAGVAIGMALRGRLPVLEIMFGDFITLCADQLVNGAGKFPSVYNGRVEVPLVVRTPMGGRRGYGPTHSQTLETLFLNAPGLTVVAPSLFHDPGGLLETAVLRDRTPVIFVENKTLYPEPLRLQQKGRCGNWHVIDPAGPAPLYPTLCFTPVPGEKPDATLAAYGGMVSLAAEAAWNVFMEEELLVELVVPSLVKPFPVEEVAASVRRSGRLLVAEEAPRTAGWGAELSAAVQENCFSSLCGPIHRVGGLDIPIPSATSMERVALPSVQDVEKALYRLCGLDGKINER